MDYKVETPGLHRGNKICHISFLKKWYPAEPETQTGCLAIFLGLQEKSLEEDIPVTEVQEENLYPMATTASNDNTPVLTSNCFLIEQSQLCALLQGFSPGIQTKPSRTTIAKHKIHVGGAALNHQRPYQIPYW